MTSMIEAIQKRVSVRSYIQRSLEEDKKQQIIKLLNSTNQGPFGNRVRFDLIDLSDMEKNEIKKYGTYGFISGAKLFIASAVKDGVGAMVDLGYCFEKVILGATDLGLGTCWLGGTFKRANFAKKINASDDEVVAAISPIGYAHHKKTTREIAVRRLVNSDQRKPWSELFFDGDINKPLSKDTAGIYAAPLECVRLGPSASNNQPWRIIYDKPKRAFHLYLKRTRGYNKLNGGIDLQLVDMGIAMCHFELAAREKGLRGTWEVKRPDIVNVNGEYIVTWKE